MWTWLISINRYRPLTDGQDWSEETGWPGTCQAGWSLPACPTWAPGRVQHPSILTPPPGSSLFLGIKRPTEVRRLLSEEVGFEDGQPAFRNHRATCRRKQGRGAGGGNAPPHPQPTAWGEMSWATWPYPLTEGVLRCAKGLAGSSQRVLFCLHNV